MKAHKPLWINDDGEITEETPDSGIKIAAASGNEINVMFVKKYDLVLEGDIVKQKTDEKKSAKKK